MISTTLPFYITCLQNSEGHQIFSQPERRPQKRGGFRKNYRGDCHYIPVYLIRVFPKMAIKSQEVWN